MAVLTITNVSTSAPVELTDLYVTLDPFGSSVVQSYGSVSGSLVTKTGTEGNGGVIVTTRALTDIARMEDLLGKMRSGLVTVQILPNADELAEKVSLLSQVEVDANSVRSDVVMFRKAFVAGSGVTGDDVPLFQLNSLPFGFRFIDAVAVISNDGGASGTLGLWTYPQNDLSPVTHTNIGTPGTSVVTISGTPVGSAATATVSIAVTLGGTIGTGPITLVVTTNGVTAAPHSLGTANTYLIPNTGVTAAFAAGTLVTGDVIGFQCWLPDVSAVTFTGTGSSAVTVTGTDAFTDTISMNTVLGGTIGTGPITIAMTVNGVTQANHSLATANSYLIPAGLGSVIHSGTGTSTVTASGTPLINATVSVAVTTGGTVSTIDAKAITVTVNGIAGAAIPLLGGTTYVEPLSGVTLTFGAGSLVAGDLYVVKCTGPTGMTLHFGAGTLVTADTAAFTTIGTTELVTFGTLSSTGRKVAVIQGNATTAVVPGSTVGLFASRSDNTVVGEVIVWARQETSLVAPVISNALLNPSTVDGSVAGVLVSDLIPGENAPSSDAS